MKRRNKPDMFDQIIDSLSPEEVAEAKAETAAKRPRGRPRKLKKPAKNQIKLTQEDIDNFESNLWYRPEPRKLIAALKLPEDQQKEAIELALLPKQIAFCREYVLDYNATQAAIRAGYSPNGAKTIGSRFLQYKGVRKLIDFYTKEASDMISLVDKDYIIRKVTEIVSTAEKDGDKLRGLELLARHLGMFIERTEITGKDGEAIKYEETRKEANDVIQSIRRMASRPEKPELSVVTGGKK